jgi:hypothetical protein
VQRLAELPTMSVNRSLLATTVAALLCNNCGFRYFHSGPNTRFENQLTIASNTSPVSSGGRESTRERCVRRAAQLAREHDRFTNAQEPLLYAGVLVAVASSVIGGISGTSRPGENAASLPEAVRSEGELSGIEISSITVGAVAAVATGLGTVFATQASNRQTRIRDIQRLLERDGDISETDAIPYCP